MTQLTRGAYSLPGTSLEFKTGNWRSTGAPVHIHAAAPCHVACPAGEDQQAWLAYIQAGNIEAAWQELVSANPLPAITGRVCPHPCETACNRSSTDGALAIHNIERWLGDEAIKHNWAYAVSVPKGDAPKVAIIGAGPAGLSAAYHCLRNGLKPVIYEALPEAGGLLRSAIPTTRLPRDVLDAELSRLLSLEGITLQTSTRLGRDVSVDELQRNYAAVVLSPGCQAAWEWDVRGAVPGELHEGLHLLKEFMDHGVFPEAKNVVVHGGGNTAIDICRLLKRSGAESVTLVTASALPGPDADPADLINVVPRELVEAQEEGIEIIEHATINRLILRGSQTTGVEIASLRKIKGADGCKRRVTFEGTERILEADMVVPCIGEKVDPEGLESLLHGAAYLPAEGKSGRLAGGNTYALGDARGDRGTVAGAIGDGLAAVSAIIADIKDAPDTTPEDRPELTAEKLNTVYFDSSSRTIVPSLPVTERGFETEIEGDIGRTAALAEAARCMSCGNCLACDNCWTLCPDSAVLKTRENTADGSHYVFDLDYCKGCGICAAECPSGFIQMAAEN